MRPERSVIGTRGPMLHRKPGSALPNITEALSLLGGQRQDKDCSWCRKARSGCIGMGSGAPPQGVEDWIVDAAPWKSHTRRVRRAEMCPVSSLCRGSMGRSHNKALRSTRRFASSFAPRGRPRFGLRRTPASILAREPPVERPLMTLDAGFLADIAFSSKSLASESLST